MIDNFLGTMNAESIVLRNFYMNMNKMLEKANSLEKSTIGR